MRDEEIEQSLIRSNRMLLEGQTNRRLTEVLLAEFGSLDRVFVIDWIPEQGEDIYTVAAPPNMIATVEISREESDTATSVLEKVPFDIYRRNTKRTTKTIRRKLSIIEHLWA